MVPSNIALVRSATSAIRRALGGEVPPEIAPSLQAAEIALNEVLLRAQPGFLDRFVVEGHALVVAAAQCLGEPAPVSAPSEQRDEAVEALLFQLAQLTDRLSRGGAAGATDILDRIVDWEVSLYAYRMETAEALSEGSDPRALFTAERFEAYLQAHRPEWAGASVAKFSTQGGGFSKITAIVELRDAAGAIHPVVIRAEPALRMLDLDGMYLKNEYPVVQIAFEAGLPVAEPLWFEGDASHIGMPFMVSRRMPGKVTGTAMGSSEPIPMSRLQSAMEVIARLHRITLDPADPRIQQSHLKRWIAQPTLAQNTREFIEYWADVAQAGDQPPSPVYTRTINWLMDNVPQDEGRSVLMHGDLTFANILFDGETFSALLDWENARIGDPADEVTNFIVATRGLIEREEVLRAYRAAGGEEISEARLRYFDVYHCLKMTVAALVSLRRVEVSPNGRAHLAMFGLRFLHFITKELNGLIRAAEGMG